MNLLVIVDYQNDFIDGSLGFEGAKKIEDYILNKIDEFKNNNDEVVYTLDTHFNDYLSTEEGKNLPIKHCIENTYGHELPLKVKEKLKDCLSFKKNSFGSNLLFDYLKTKDYESVTLMGLVSNMCVLANAVICKTALPNAHIIVDSKGSASFDKELEKKGYDILRCLHIEVK